VLLVLKNTCNILDQELTETVNYDTRKNEVFVNTRAQIDEIIKAVKHFLRETKKQYNSIKTNNEVLRSVTEIMRIKTNEAKTGTFPTQHAEEFEEHKGEIISNKGFYTNMILD